MTTGFEPSSPIACNPDMFNLPEKGYRTFGIDPQIPWPAQERSICERCSVGSNTGGPRAVRTRRCSSRTSICRDGVRTHARRCLSAGYDRTGNWDLAQTCRHSTDWLRAPLEGPPPMPWLMRLPMAIIRLTLGPRILRQFLGNRRLPVGMGTIDATVHPPESNANAAVAAFASMVAQFNSHTGPLMRPSPLFNRPEREQTLDLQIVHCMHHFGHLKPHAGIVADTTENLAQ